MVGLLAVVAELGSLLCEIKFGNVILKAGVAVSRLMTNILLYIVKCLYICRERSLVIKNLFNRELMV